MKSKKYLFLNSYNKVLIVILIVLTLLVYNFSNSFYSILEGMLIKTDTNQAGKQIEKDYNRKKSENEGNLTKNERKFIDMHDRAF